MSERDRPSRIASGHPETSRAAAEVLDAGGSAADAAIAAALTATVAEPLLCSLGGGAHGLVQGAGRAPVALDAFTQTPRRRRLGELDFYPILGNFGTEVQEFHVGMASIATPGAIAGLFALHERFGHLPWPVLAEPAIRLARQGVRLNPTQAFANRILEPIVRSTTDCAAFFGLAQRDDALPPEGSLRMSPAQADFIDALAREGPELFYHGEPARQLTEACASRGGHLKLADLAGYRARWRRPLRWRYRNATLWSTPPPAFGGMMLSLACRQLERHLQPGTAVDSPEFLAALCLAMNESEGLRRQLEQPELLASETALRAAFRGLDPSAPVSQRGTTHISIDDGRGMAVALTLSNGEASGYVLPGTGILLNNMLGEEDINRGGFHAWPCNRRLASMMAPTFVQQGRQRWILGSGGSNRIRTALVQVISRLVDFQQPLARAVEAPRAHLERGLLSIEMPPGEWPTASRDWLFREHHDARCWPERNMYFGGVQAVGPNDAVADPRRDGLALAGKHY
ncbi:MAG: gamma-glutamyltransferase [Wenzhouxiangella sp.]